MGPLTRRHRGGPPHDGELQGVPPGGDETRMQLPQPYWAPSEQRQSVFLDGMRVLLRHKVLFASIVLCGAVLGYLSTLPRASVYRARTLLDIQPLNENFFTMKKNEPGGAATPTFVNAESFLQTQIKLLQSNSVVDRVVRKLKARPEQAAPTAAQPPAQAAIGSTQPASRQEAVNYTAARFKVRAVGATRLVEVLCDGHTPALAMEFCNTLSTEFIESSLEVRSEMAQRTSQWLTGQLTDLRKNLATSEERLQSFAREAAIVSSPDRETIAQERLRNLQNELTKAQAELMGKQSQYELALSRPPESLTETADSPVFREYSLRLTDLQRQRAELTVALTPDHPRVQKIDVQIAEVKSGLAREQDRVVGRVRNDRDGTAKREAALAAAFSQQFSTVSGQAEKAVTYNMLRREVESERQLYEVMLQRVREVGFASAMRDSTIRVVDAATLPDAPVSPSIPSSVAGGLALGCLFGIGLVFLRDNNDHRVRLPADVTAGLGIPELGVIPGVGSGPARTFAERHFGARIGSRGDGRPELATLTESMSSVAEAFRATMNSVLFASGEDSACRVIVVTSPGIREGKTTLSMNLAAALAETGRRVLLIDGDMRKPRLHDIVRHDNSFGLHDILASEEPVEELSLERLARPTAMRGLWLMPSGTTPRNISKLLHSKRLGAMMARLREDFEIVVLDTSPVLPVSDARLFGRLSDGVLLVVRGNQTTMEDALRARNLLTADGVPILGTIFNDWRGPKTSYYYSTERSEVQ